MSFAENANVVFECASISQIVGVRLALSGRSIGTIQFVLLVVFPVLVNQAEEVRDIQIP